jgi:magnesium transporter
VRVIRLEDGKVKTGGRELVRPGAPMWIDLAPTTEHVALVGERFGFHPLALEDCLHEDQRPKFEQYPGSLFSVVHRLTPTPDDSALLALEIDAFLTGEVLVTFHAAPIAELDRIFERCAAEPELLGRGPDFVLYLVHDAITDVHFALVDALTSDIEEVADESAAASATSDGRDLLDRIAALRRSHAMLRRRLSPQREVFAAFARPGQQLVKDQTSIYFRNVVDHSVRLTEEIDLGRDLLASSMDVYLSHSNNRLTAVSARLSLIATIFLPLNFVAGFFGMNLEILTPGTAVPVVLGAMVIMPATMYAVFRRKGWV